MLIYHQTGHNLKWNNDSFQDDKVGHGLIYSPVNLDSNKLDAIKPNLKQTSIFDPQLYVPKDDKGKLDTYDYFPTNLATHFKTSDFHAQKAELSKRCLDIQLKNDFEYLIIPTRFFENLPHDYLYQNQEFFIEPFIEYYKSSSTSKNILLTVILTSDELLNSTLRDNLLNWLTGINGINGVYLILNNNFTTKQIKSTDYLIEALKFIYILKQNSLKVIIGYTNTEGILYSLAGADAITIGSYDNLRNFKINRFITPDKKSQIRQPSPRIYCSKLLQWIDNRYIGGIKLLYKNWVDLFDVSKYNPLGFKKVENWHFKQPELYKHYFIVFSNQVNLLPSDIGERVGYVKSIIKEAIVLFQTLDSEGVVLDQDSDGSHLNFWLTSINAFDKFLKDSI